MPIQQVSLGLRSNPDRSNDDGAARLINCYAEDMGADAKQRYPIYACDGYSSFSTLTGTGAGVVRGFLNFDDSTLYCVTGTRINRVNTSGTATDMAALATSGYAYFARNNAATPNIMLVTSDALIRTITSNTVSTPTLDASIPTTEFNSVCSIDGYFIITCSGGDFYITGIDTITVDPLDFAAASTNSDGLMRGIRRGPELVLLGARSTEFWRNTGNVDFPFERVHSSNFGCYAAASAVTVSAVVGESAVDAVIYAGTNTDGALIGVLLVAGYEARKISPPGLDRAIRSEPTLSSIRAFIHTQHETTFYCITGSSFTWEYNLRTGFWHERTSDGLDIWNIVDAVQFNGKTIYADYNAATLYQASSSLTPASASSVTLRQSLNGGTTWATTRTKSIGGSGSERTRLRFNRLGIAREDGRVLEFKMTNAVIENSTANSITVVPPAVHAYPNRTICHAAYVDVTSGASQTSKAKGFLNLAVDIMGLEP